MSRHLRIATGFAVAIAVLVVLARWFGGPGAFVVATATDRAADGGAGPLQEVLAVPTDQSAVDEAGDQSGVSHSRQVLDADPSCIKIRLRDREGLPARGVVTCAASWKPPSALPPLDGNHLRTVAEQGSSGPIRIVELGDVLGDVGIERSAAAFTWLRIDSRACGGPVFARVGPAAGPVEIEVVLPSLRHRVHIQALRADLLGIAAGASLLCTDTKGLVVWQGRADVHGYAIAELPGAGDYVVRAAGASHLDGDQVRVRLSAVPHDATAVVALPEERHRVGLVVSAVFDEQATLLPTLLLLRIDPGRSVVACVTASLRRGLSRHQVEVPAGDYQIVVLPQGALRAVGGESLVRIGPGGVDEVPLQLEPATRATVHLQGISASKVPFTVRWLHENDLAEDGDERIWCGPVRWQRTQEQVARWPAPAWLLARGRGEAWLSERCVEPTNGTARVSMRRAGELVLTSAVDRRPRPSVVVVRHEDVEFVRLVHACVAASPAGVEPVDRAVVYVPFGSAQIEWRDAMGAILGERRIEVASSRHVESLP